jgi:type VI secretion system secreted protein VgrG
MVAKFDIPFAPDRVSSVVPLGAGDVPFELQAGPWGRPDLTVLSFHGREAISRPFRFEITVAASQVIDDAMIAAELLAQLACLTMQAGVSGPRCVRGVIDSVRAESRTHDGRATYRLRLVPAFALLQHRVTSRVFQEQTVPEIVSAVLGETVAHASRLLGKYRPRTYCVQYKESDFAFVERLLAEEGIFYTFEPGGADATTETMVLSDSAHLYPAIEGDPELAYRPSEDAAGMTIEEHHVQRFALRRSLRPTSVLRRGYDFRRPALDLTAEAKLDDTNGGEPSRGEIYEHHEPDEEPNVRPESVTAELEQHRARVEVARGTSGCRRLVPGARFQLRDHDLDRLDGEYVLTRVDHRGRAPEIAHGGEPVYANTFACVLASVTARPHRPAREVQQVAETAVVVGPEGQEIYTDEHGRVKVQFHWDREGRRDERSSCWIRVAQAWTGSGWGFQFVPRIGMEVVVTFLGGDVDRPLITGCVPNAINVPPFPLPRSDTRSGIRTRSSPGGSGCNELSFEDKKDGEQIFLRAQRNLDEEILADHATTVGGNRRMSVSGARSDRVEGDIQLRGAGNRLEEIGGDQIVSIGRSTSVLVGGRQAIAIAGDACLRVGGDHVVVVRGNLQTLIGHGADESNALLYVNGSYNMSSASSTSISAAKTMTLACGDSSIELSPAGIKLKAKSITIEGGEGAALAVKGHELKMGEDIQIVSDRVALFSSKGSLVMDDDVKIDGKLVKLNCEPKRPDPSEPTKDDPEDGVATFHIADRASGEPRAGVKLLIATPAGEVVEHETDSAGKVDIKGKKGEHYVLVSVRDGDHVLGVHGGGGSGAA